MSVTKIESEVSRIGSRGATDLLLKSPYDRQRNLKEWWVSNLIEIMRSGDFAQGSQIKIGILKGQAHLINGNHRLNAIARSGLPQYFVITKVYVEDEEDLALLYIREDRVLTRSFKDIVDSYELSEKLQLSYYQISKMAGAVKFIDRSFMPGRSHITDKDLFLLLQTYASACKIYFSLIAGSSYEMKNALTRAATLSVALVTLKYTPSEILWRVREFWRGISLPELEIWSENDARILCYQHLKTTYMPGGLSKISINIRTPAHSARYISACYNLWMLGGQFKEPSISDTLEPIEIAFSPYKQNHQVVGEEVRDVVMV